jgi:hypothetical protein
LKIVRTFTDEHGETHIEVTEQGDFDYVEHNGRRTKLKTATGVQLNRRESGDFDDFHNAPRRQWILYLTATVEIGVSDGTVARLEPGDVLQVEDRTGRGHTSRVIHPGISATIRLDP